MLDSSEPPTRLLLRQTMWPAPSVSIGWTWQSLLWAVLLSANLPCILYHCCGRQGNGSWWYGTHKQYSWSPSSTLHEGDSSNRSDCIPSVQLWLESSQCNVKHYLDDCIVVGTPATSSLMCISFPSGSQISICTVSNSIPKKSRRVAGPTLFSSASGRLSSLHVQGMVSRFSLHSKLR